MKFHEPFSPVILETTVPKRFVDIVNDVADDVLKVLSIAGLKYYSELKNKFKKGD